MVIVHSYVKLPEGISPSLYMGDIQQNWGFKSHSHIPTKNIAICQIALKQKSLAG